MTDATPRRWRNPFRAERLGGYMPFLWYGMSMRHWWELLSEAQFSITANRIPNVLGATLMSPVSSLIPAISEAIFRRQAEQTPIIPPLFVLGHWRTGTSFLHNLITADPATSFPTTFNTNFPGAFVMTERRMAWLLDFFLPAVRPMDEVPLSQSTPFEDEFAIAKTGLASPYRALAYPALGRPSLKGLDVTALPEDERRKWENGFLWLMRRLQLSRPGKRLVLKSPPHTARIATLLKLFPDGRFVHIARDPFAVYPSTIKLWKILHSRLGLQNPANDDSWLPGHVLDALPAMYAAYERDLPLVPPDRLVEIRYEDLVANPVATLGELYRKLDIGRFDPAPVEAYLATLTPHEPRPPVLSDAERQAVRERWGFYFQRFGYREDGTPLPCGH